MKVNEYLKNKFIDEGLLSKSKAEDAYQVSMKDNKPYFETLVEKNYLEDNEVYNFLAKLFNLEFIDINIHALSDNLIDKVDNVFLNETRVIPLSLYNNTLTVVIDSPFNLGNVNLIRYYLNYDIDVKLIKNDAMEVILANIANKDRRIKAIEEVAKEDEKISKTNTNNNYSLDEYLDAPAVQFADSLLQEAVTQGASDIHIEPNEKEVRVRFRIDGVLREHCKISLKLFQAVLARYKIMAGLDIAERRIPQDGKISSNINNNEYDFRVSTLPLIHGEKIVIRIYNSRGDEIRLSNLTSDKEAQNTMKKMISSPHGIILLTGPTGSGKTTTLYAFLKELNGEDINITTIEDPVENQIKGINQTQVNTKTNLTFASALRSILRQDPNVIMVGEIRDEETAHIAVQAAITGHLVLSTIHTNDALTTITRLVDMNIEPYLVADSLIGAISQRLVRRLCPHCKKPHIVTKEEARALGCEEGTKIFEPKGCSICNNTGYQGRVPVFEILAVDEDFKTAIDQKSQDFTIEPVKKLFDSKRIKSIRQSCIDKVLDGTTSIEEFSKLVDFSFKE